MAGSDFSLPFIAGFGQSAFPARTGGALHLRPVTRYPGSRAKSVHTCWGLRPRRTETPLAITWRPMLPSGCVTPSASGICFFRGSMASLHDPLPTLRPVPRGTRRTARGRCDSLRLHRRGLSPPTPCRSPGALRISHVGKPMPRGFRTPRQSDSVFRSAKHGVLESDPASIRSVREIRCWTERLRRRGAGRARLDD